MAKIRSKKQKETVKKRIEKLFKQAKKAFRKDKKLANKYVKLGRELAMKYRIKLPRRLKRKFCKHCYSYLVPGENCRVRTRGNKVVYYCMECKKYMRFPYVKEKKAKRKK